MLPFTVEALEAAVADGSVTKRPHPSAPYFIFNYSPETQFSKKWNDVTRACRGLILDEDYNIIARPWEKFFNLGEVELPMQFTDPVEVMDKADGSLGILYPMPRGEDGMQHYAISTRGSFQSKQAVVGSEIWVTKYAHRYEEILEALDEQYTFLFEIIYPSNRIVLNYGDMYDLMLLGAVQNENGYYIGAEHARSVLQWTGPVVKTFDYANLSQALSHADRENAEGYVIKYHNFLVKVKQPDYLELHKLVTNASPKTVWAELAKGKTRREIVSAFPDEFHTMINGFIDPLVKQYDERVDEIYNSFTQEMSKCNRLITPGGSPLTRGDYARVFKKHKDARYFFAMLDEKPIRDVVWQELKPRGD